MTIHGVVTPHRQAVIQLSVLGSTQRRTIPAIIDTGFNDFLALSSPLINELGLSFEAKLVATLADGQTVETSSYRAKILWDGESREVLAVACDGGPLVLPQVLILG